MIQRGAGFTLVEVIVALAIMSLVMLATVTGFRTLGNTATTITKMTARTDELRSVSAFLRDALENSVAGAHGGQSQGLSFGGNDGVSRPVAYFRVEEGRLAWRAKILFGEAYGGSYFLRLVKLDDKLMLQWQEPEGQTEPGDWQQAPGREVLDNLELFEVWTREGAEAEWTQENIEREAPSHVKLVIKANGRFWPELVMQVQQ
jgi:general secretion pathway protein J